MNGEVLPISRFLGREERCIIPLHPAAEGLILHLLEESGHGVDLGGSLFRPIRNTAQKPGLGTYC